MIGIAFSLGFTVGPLMGAYFAASSRGTGNVFYQTPALLALAFSVTDLLFIWLMLPETLTKDSKVSLRKQHHRDKHADARMQNKWLHPGRRRIHSDVGAVFRSLNSTLPEMPLPFDAMVYLVLNFFF